MRVKCALGLMVKVPFAGPVKTRLNPPLISEEAAKAFIALALLARRRNWDTTTGVALGLATLAKLFPIVTSR